MKLSVVLLAVVALAVCVTTVTNAAPVRPSTLFVPTVDIHDVTDGECVDASILTIEMPILKCIPVPEINGTRIFRGGEPVIAIMLQSFNETEGEWGLDFFLDADCRIRSETNSITSGGTECVDTGLLFRPVVPFVVHPVITSQYLRSYYPFNSNCEANPAPPNLVMTQPQLQEFDHSVLGVCQNDGDPDDDQSWVIFENPNFPSASVQPAIVEAPEIALL